MNLKDTADVAGRHSALQLADRRVEPLDVTNSQQFPADLCRVDQRPALGQVGRDRLFDQNMDAPSEGALRHLEMSARRHGDHGGVEALLFEHVAPRPISLDAVLARSSVDGRRVLVADRDQVSSRQLAQEPDVIAPHRSKADHRNAGHDLAVASRRLPATRSTSESLSAG